MATKKISALTTGTTATATDKIPIERSGANNYITPAMIAAYLVSAGKMGLVAQYHNSAAITIATGVAVIDFNTADYDPLSTVTTGASWVFTAPETGRYDFRLCACFIDPNGFAWASSGDGISITLRKNGTTTYDLAYWDSENGGAGTSHYPFLTGTRTLSLTASDTVAFRRDNFSGQTRKIGSGALIEVHRVA